MVKIRCNTAEMGLVGWEMELKSFKNSCKVSIPTDQQCNIKMSIRFSNALFFETVVWRFRGASNVSLILSYGLVY